MVQRSVVVTDDFFDDLNALLPEARTSGGGLSRTDFLAYVMPSIIDTLAADFEGSTIVWRPGATVRVRITPSPAGIVTVYAALAGDVVSVVGVEIDQT